MGRNYEESPNSPENSAFTSFLGEHDRSLFGVLVSARAAKIDPLEVAGQHYPYVRRVQAPGFTTTFLQNIYDGEDAIIVADSRGYRDGIFTINREQEEIYFYNSTEVERHTLESHEVASLTKRLTYLNDWYEEGEKSKINEGLENRLRISVKRIIDGHSDHPLIRFRSAELESGTVIKDAIISDDGLFIELSRHELKNGSTDHFIQLMGRGVPKDLQRKSISLDFETSRYSVWNSPGLDLDREERTYIDESPCDFQTDTHPIDNSSGYDHILTDKGAEDILSILTPYESNGSFSKDEKHRPPSAELMEALSLQIEDILTGSISIPGMTHEDTGTYYKRRAELREKTRAQLNDLLWIEMHEGGTGKQTIRLAGKKVPSDIRNMEFRLDPEDNRLVATRIPEDTESFLFFKQAFLVARQGIRKKKGHFYKEFLVSHYQAKVLNDFLAHLRKD